MHGLRIRLSFLKMTARGGVTARSSVAAQRAPTRGACGGDGRGDAPARRCGRVSDATGMQERASGATNGPVASPEPPFSYHLVRARKSSRENSLESGTMQVNVVVHHLRSKTPSVHKLCTCTRPRSQTPRSCKKEPQFARRACVSHWTRGSHLVLEDACCRILFPESIFKRSNLGTWYTTRQSSCVGLQLDQPGPWCSLRCSSSVSRSSAPCAGEKASKA